MPRTVRNPIAEFYQRRTPTQWAFIASCFAFIILGYATWDAFRDDPPPDVSDLLIKIHPVPDEDNGLVLLEEIGEELAAIDQEPTLDELFHVDDSDSPVDWEAIGARLKKMQAPLARLPDALARPSFQANTLWDLEAILVGGGHSLGIMRILSTRVKLGFHEQRPNTAWEDILLNLRLGQRLQTEETSVDGFYIGIAGSAIGLNDVNELLLELAPSPTVTRQRNEQIKSCQPTADDLHRMFKTEVFLMITSGNAYVQNLAQCEYGPFAPIFYKPNRTLKHLGPLLREALANVDRPYARMDWPYSKKISHRGIGPYNYWGNEFVWGYMFQSLLEKTRKLEANFATTRVGLALAGYANQHDGELPESLDQLVPDYIDALPLDPMDGEPLRYDREERKVWSIGRNLTDEGGLPGDAPRYQEPHDIVVEIPLPER